MFELRVIFVFLIWIVTSPTLRAQSVSASMDEGNRLIKAGNLSEAIKSFEDAKSHALVSRDWNAAIQSLHQIAGCYMKMPDMEGALRAANEAIGIEEENSEYDPLLRAETLTILGNIHLQKSDYPSSLNAYQKAIDIARKYEGKEPLKLAGLYQSIRVPLSFRGEYRQAYEYDKMALSIYRKQYGERHPAIGKAYFNIGTYYYGLENFDEAVSYFTKAIDVYGNTVGLESMEVADVYRTVGRIYVKTGQWDKVIETQKKGLSIYMKFTHGKNPYIVLFHWNIGDAYRFTGKLEPALEQYLAAVEKARELLGEKHPGVASSIFRVSEYYEAVGSLDKALSYCQSGLIATTAGFSDTTLHKNPPVNNAIDDQVLLGGLQRKAMLLEKKFGMEDEMASLEASAAAYLSLDTLIDRKRQAYRSHEDKISLGRIARSIYESAIKTNLKLHTLKGDKSNLEQAFYFSEKSKAAILTDALYDISARGLSPLPAELSELEQKLRNDLSGTRSKIVRLNQQNTNSPEKQDLEDQLFKQQRRMDSLQSVIAATFPSYHNLRYPKPPMTISMIQARLPEEVAMLHYFEGAEQTYVFSISADSVSVTTVKRDSLYNTASKDLLTVLQQSSALDVNAQESFSRFSESAYSVFQTMVTPPLQILKNKNTKSLVIIPDGILSYIPFEVLLSEKPSHTNYRELPYLMRQYAVQYGYSATLQFGSPLRRDTRPGGNQLSFAPEYDAFPDDSVNVIALGKFREVIGPLRWNREEVLGIEKKVGGAFFTGRDATESRFRQEASEYDVLHLAMHALIDDVNPMNSKLVFASEDSGQDGYLHAFELYNMQLQARMVVLSACNTAYGKFAKGEGIMSLARGFAYAGVPSVVMSHWKVDDESTHLLMQEFYTALKTGKTKSESLRVAKLNYLKNADPAKVHPVFWAAFVGLGDDEPVFQNTISRWYYIAGGTVLLIIIASIFFRKRDRRSSLA